MNRILQALSRTYRTFIDGLAIVAEAGIAFILVSIIYDVAARNLGLPSLVWISAAVEYSLYAITLLIAPKLIRDKGHIAVQSIVQLLPPATRRGLDRMVVVVCVLLCAVMTFYGADMALESYRRGEFDVRAFEMPRWILFAALSAGFAINALEFARFLFGTRSLFPEGDPDDGI